MSGRVAFVQSQEWERRQGGAGAHQDIYSDKHCAICGRPIYYPLTFIRLSRTNDGQWWAVDYYRLEPLPDEARFGVFRLPIGTDCANKHPEWAHAINLPVDVRPTDVEETRMPRKSHNSPVPRSRFVLVGVAAGEDQAEANRIMGVIAKALSDSLPPKTPMYMTTIDTPLPHVLVRK